MDCLSHEEAKRPNKLTLGRSSLGLPIEAFRLGPLVDCDPIVIIAGQHGDEPLGRVVATRVRAYLSAQRLTRTIWILPNVNPDGAILGTRNLGSGADLNRDHLSRISVEAQLIYRFLNLVKPLGVIDLHTCPARRRWMKSLNWQHALDCMVDGPTGPAQWLSGCNDVWQKSLLDIAHSALLPAGYRCGRYWLRSASGRIRHSTPDWVDLRNHASSFFRCPAVLIEGLQPPTAWSSFACQEQARRTVDAMIRVTIALLEDRDLWRTQGCDQPPSKLCDHHGHGSIPLQFKYCRTGQWTAPMQDRRSGEIVQRVIPGRYTGRLTPKLTTQPATEFWIPAALKQTVAHLRRLDAPLQRLIERDFQTSVGTWQQWRITGAEVSQRQRRSARNVSVVESLVDPSDFGCLVGFQLSPHPGSAAFWTMLLDPQSKYGLARFYPNELPVRTGTVFPILFRRSCPSPTRLTPR